MGVSREYDNLGDSMAIDLTLIATSYRQNGIPAAFACRGGVTRALICRDHMTNNKLPL